jgi:TatD DNase family protein
VTTGCIQRSEFTRTTHPHQIEAELRGLAHSGALVAVGEIGLDFYRLLSPRNAQLDAFQRQLSLAAELALPVVVHTRDALDEAYDMLSHWAAEQAQSSPHGVMHCFSGTLEEGHSFADLGFLISIPATVTYPKNDEQRRVARELPLEVLVVETDSPYLPPQHLRGKRNDLTHVLDAIAVVAQVRGQPQDEIVKAMSDNARRLFRL